MGKKSKPQVFSSPPASAAHSSIMAATVKDDPSKIEGVLTEVFRLMDANNDESIDQEEGCAIGVAMGESEDQALKSWKAMCKDMDDDENTTIELSEWLEFYKKSLADAPLDDVLAMLNQMKDTIATQKKE